MMEFERIVVILRHVLVVILMVFGVDLVPAHAEKIMIGATSYWNPFCYKSEVEPYGAKGFSVDVLRQILEDDGKKPVFVILPWKRCLRMLEFKQLDLVLDGSMNSERLGKYIFSDEMYRVEHVLIYSKKKFPDGPVIDNAADIGRYSLGGLAGFNFEVYPFDVSQVQDSAADYRGLLAMLQFERFDLAIGLKQVVLAHAKMNNLDMSEFGMLKIPMMNSIPFYVLASNTPSGKILIRRINKGLVKLRESGEYETYLIKHGIEVIE